MILFGGQTHPFARFVNILHLVLATESVYSHRKLGLVVSCLRRFFDPCQSLWDVSLGSNAIFKHFTEVKLGTSDIVPGRFFKQFKCFLLVFGNSCSTGIGESHSGLCLAVPLIGTLF